MNIDSEKIANFLGNNQSPEMEGEHDKRHISYEVMVNLAVNLWRLKRAISFLELETDTIVMKRLNRHIKAAADDLELAGFVFEDLDGKRVPAAGDYALKTVEFIPTEGLEYDTVLETIKPNVFFNGKLIQPGEVIVGIPITRDDENSLEDK